MIGGRLLKWWAWAVPVKCRLRCWIRTCDPPCRGRRRCSITAAALAVYAEDVTGTAAIAMARLFRTQKMVISILDAFRREDIV